MAKESEVAWNTVFEDTMHIARFHDNIVCLCPLAELEMHIPQVKDYLEEQYGLQLDHEQAGRSLPDVLRGTGVV